ncbi:MAG: four helix bundle protein [Kiritimatiellia bacterium]
MATIKRFEDIEAWQKARELTRQVYVLSKTGDFAHDFGLKDQIRRASVSIMSNIAEGFERGGNKEFMNFLRIAKGSCGEVRAQLYVVLDQGYVDKDQFDALFQITTRVSVMLQAFIATLRNSDLKGPRYK